jgi:murein L,D-transpeptidase YcbB/YkuD
MPLPVLPSFRVRFWPLALWLTLCSAALAAPDEQELSALLTGDAPQIRIDGVRLWSTPVLRELYRSGNLGWTESRLRTLRAEIERAREDGLDPADFLADELAHPERVSPGEFELLASEALARLAFTLRYGKANPLALDSNWNYSRELGTTDPVAWLRAAITNDSLPTLLRSLRPRGPYYRALQDALSAQRGIAGRGGWPTLAAGATLKRGMDDPRVPLLRARLVASGDIDAAGAGPDSVYDPALVAAVESFQRRHGLEADGAVGRTTLAELNVPVSARIDQLRVNLERIRWVFRDLAGEFVVVNIAGFGAAYFVDGEMRWSARAIVGRPYRQTPVFKDELTYLELNPTWTVPPTILRNDILPKLRDNPAYLREKKLRIVDPNGGPVSAAGIDWRKVSAANFRYYLRQDPGPDNALGRIKFMFPNAHAVYLHDTPARELFRQSERTFSSGCIRIENPLALAELLLRDPAQWNQASLQATIDTGQTRRVNLPRKVPIMLLYLTAFPDRTGHVQFRRDVYKRDARTLQALDGPLVWTPTSDFSRGGQRTASLGNPEARLR